MIFLKDGLSRGEGGIYSATCLHWPPFSCRSEKLPKAYIYIIRRPMSTMVIEKSQESRFLFAMNKILNVLIVVAFGLMTLFAFMQVVMRYFLQYPAPWTEETARYLMIFVIFIGAGLVVRDDTHIRIDLIEKYLPERYVKKLRDVVALICLVISVAFFVCAFEYEIFIFRSGDRSITTGALIGIPALSMAIGSALMVFYFILRLYRTIVK